MIYALRIAHAIKSSGWISTKRGQDGLVHELFYGP